LWGTAWTLGEGVFLRASGEWAGCSKRVETKKRFGTGRLWVVALRSISTVVNKKVGSTAKNKPRKDVRVHVGKKKKESLNMFGTKEARGPYKDEGQSTKAERAISWGRQGLLERGESNPSRQGGLKVLTWGGLVKSGVRLEDQWRRHFSKRKGSR